MAEHSLISPEELSSGKVSYPRLEYLALRTEIDYLTKMLMQFQGLSITGIPIIIGAGEKYNFDFVVYAAPIITIVFALMLLFIQNSIMRAGEYIRTILEKKLQEDEEGGWEAWLEKYTRNRTAESFFAWSAHIAFCLYYLGGTYLASQRLYQKFSPSIGAAAIGVYLAIFLFSLVLLVINLRVNTKSN
jgi:low affinity Fe/Cu permease